MRAAFEKPRSLGLENAAQGVAIGVSAYLPVMVTARRNEDTRRGTASGNYRSRDIAAGPHRDPRIPASLIAVRKTDRDK
jgi:hypothetical protein